MLPQSESTDKAFPPRLIVDAMLGRLARWLRLMGYDTVYWRTGSDAALAAQAQGEDRLIITRDRELAGRRGVRALYVQAETLDAQIEEVRAALGADPESLSRCAECNGELVEITHAEARPLVPTYVWHTQTFFKRCRACGRVYWRGTHWPGMNNRLEAPEE
jgi:uncharacterized protein